MPYILLVCQSSLALILLFAAISKLLYTQQLIIAMRVSTIPQFLVVPAATILITLEAELALSLIWSIQGTLPLTFGGTLLLLGAFTGWLISVYRRQLHVECGCFGASHAKVGKGSIIRNIALMGVSAAGLLLALRTPDILPPSPPWAFGLSAIIMGATVLLLSNRHRFKNTQQDVSTSHFA